MQPKFHKMLSIRQATIAFDREIVLHKFSLDIHRGEWVCLGGASGSGKSSLAKAILGFVPLQEGEIWIDGEQLSAATVHSIRQKTAWIPQEVALPIEWVKEMVRLPLELRANRKCAFNDRLVLDEFRALGLSDELYQKRVREVSGGQRQRIMLAVASLMNKPLMIIDEPTSALDAKSAEKVIAFLRLLSERGSAILSISHDRKVAAEADRTVLLP